MNSRFIIQQTNDRFHPMPPAPLLRCPVIG
jgi:hypothetical protein